jgi:site-specific recombinase XerD
VPAAAITRDNFHLSRPIMAQLGASVSAIKCTHSLPDDVTSYVCDSLAPNTRRAYLSDLTEFERWGGSIPASIETIAAYLADRADALAVATLVRHVASISKAHEARGLPNPTRSELVRATLRGSIKRKRGCVHREAKPLLRDDLLMVLDAMGDDPKDIRDRALLLIGFAGALRRSELVGLDVGDIEHVRQGIILHLRLNEYWVSWICRYLLPLESSFRKPCHHCF